LLVADFGLLIGNHVRLMPDATAALVTQVSLQSRSAIVGHAKCGSVIQQLEDAPLDNAISDRQPATGNQQSAISNQQSAIPLCRLVSRAMKNYSR
jgi:hypothetical protein